MKRPAAVVRIARQVRRESPALLDHAVYTEVSRRLGRKITDEEEEAIYEDSLREEQT